MAQQMTITPEALASMQASKPATRQYVLVDGGLVQYGSDTVDVIDIDFTNGSVEYAEFVVEEALQALRLMNQHGFRVGNEERKAVVGYLRDANAEAGLEAHHPDCDRLNSWYNVNDAYRDAEPEAELFDCNIGCDEALTDTDADLEQFTVIDVNQSEERIG